LAAAGAPIIGTSPDSIDLAEDRERFQKLVEKLGIQQPPNGTVRNEKEALQVAKDVGYPLVVRPSYVLGGRAMEVVFNDEDLIGYLENAVQVSNDSPVLLDRFLDLAVEVDIDAICDGEQVFVAGVMEHIEQAGVHSGDSGCCLPPNTLSEEIQADLKRQVVDLALALNVKGLMNAQFAIQNGSIFILEVNPRASRTVPFVSKAIGLPIAKIAARVMAGESLTDQGIQGERRPPFFSVKESVFPFDKFPESDPILGPEMRSTGEVMGSGRSFGEAYAKAQLASGVVLPTAGTALLSVRDQDKPAAAELARELIDRGFDIVATHGTASALEAAGIACQHANKVHEGRPHIVDMIKNDEITLIVNTTEGKQAIHESHSIRSEAVHQKVTYYTTVSAARATCEAMDHQHELAVFCLQDLHQEVHV
jgi:carbamoyl-phosphate synthase large subunit